MSLDEQGKLITTALRNVHPSRDLTSEEEAIAALIAPSIAASRRNWIPVFVEEVETHNYTVVGSPVILQASRLAGLKLVHCIQVDEDPQVREQIRLFESISRNPDEPTQSNNNNEISTC